MNLIYGVFGSTGEYSDRTEWFVVAYANRETAQKHAKIAQKIADELERDYYWECVLNGESANKYDPGMVVYGGSPIYYRVQAMGYSTEDEPLILG